MLAVLDWTARAGGALLLDAWCRAFAPDDDVTLLLHAFSSDGAGGALGPRVLEAVRAAGHDPERMPDVVLLEESLPAAAMGALYGAADLVVAPTVGFGRGRDLLEAMACGRPVIAPPASPAIDADVDWALGVDPATGGPRRAELVDALRDAHARRGELAGMGALARDRAGAPPTRREAVARRALARLEEIEPRPAPALARGRPRARGPLRGDHPRPLPGDGQPPPGGGAGARRRGGPEPGRGGARRRRRRGRGGRRRGAPRLPSACSREGPEVTIRHGYPPSFARPPAGRLVVALPWEFGAMPRDWRSAIHRDVDEVWACSRHLRDGYLASGLDPDLVRVVPHGVDPERFRPGLEPLPLPGVPGGYRFLFVGGLLWRKGIDLLLDAYRAAFTARDDVTLVIKDFGRGGPYQPQEAEERVRAMAADPSGPRVAFLRDRLSDDEIPRLYASCDCLVHPYRGEGYGLTVAEGMAAGLPVIVPEGGSTADFCDAEHRAAGAVAPPGARPHPGGRPGPGGARQRDRGAGAGPGPAHARRLRATATPRARDRPARERAHPGRPQLGRRGRDRGRAAARAERAERRGGGRRVSAAALTTIVLPCHDNLLYTALCLESIARHTPEPHEVVVVDNGCTDATSEWSEAQGARVVRSPVNLGFAGGVNLGLGAGARRRGRGAEQRRAGHPGLARGPAVGPGARAARRHRGPALELGLGRPDPPGAALRARRRPTS